MPSKIRDGLTNAQRYRRRHPDRVAACHKRRMELGKIVAYKAKRRLEIIGPTLHQQKGRCAICGRRLQRPCQDHDHRCCKKTGARDGFASGCSKCRRGLLCSGCNSGLSLVENPKKHKAAILYLAKWKKKLENSWRAEE